MAKSKSQFAKEPCLDSELPSFLLAVEFEHFHSSFDHEFYIFLLIWAVTTDYVVSLQISQLQMVCLIWLNAPGQEVHL